MIVSSASLSGVIALTPLPVVDLIPLLANQTSMVLSIARIYNYKIIFSAPASWWLLLVWVSWQIALLSTNKLGGSSWLQRCHCCLNNCCHGYAAVLWFEKGVKLSSETLKNLTTEVTKTLFSLIKSFAIEKNKLKLQEEIELTLKENPLNFDQPSTSETVVETISEDK